MFYCVMHFDVLFDAVIAGSLELVLLNSFFSFYENVNAVWLCFKGQSNYCEQEL